MKFYEFEANGYKWQARFDETSLKGMKYKKIPDETIKRSFVNIVVMYGLNPQNIDHYNENGSWAFIELIK